MTDGVAANVLPRRADVPREHTWNAESVFPNREAFKHEVAAVTEQIKEFERFKGRLAESPQVLAEWMEFFGKLFVRTWRLVAYAGLAAASDTEDQEAAGMSSQGDALFGQLLGASGFMNPELLAIGRETLDRWIKQEPRLAIYTHYIDDLFRKQAHVRSGDVEEVLGMLVDPFFSIGATREFLLSADFKFAPAVSSAGEQSSVAPSTMEGLMASPDRELRRTAWESYADGYLALKNTLANNLSTMVKVELVNVRARRYPSALDAALFENNIPAQVYHNLMDTYQKNLPTWHRYWRIRRKALGVEKLQPYDVWAPLTRAQPVVSYEQAIEWITAGLEPLGEEYVSTLRRGCLQDRWVDRYPNQGKREAQFSSGAPGTYPFVMLKYHDDINSMSVLAHELGHSMHSYLTWQTQPPIYANYSIFVAEVASNFNQAMVRAYLLDTSDDPDFQMAVLEEALHNFHRYFFTMPTLARFELEMHRRMEQGQPIPADSLIDLMAGLYEEAYGGEMEIDRSRVGINWGQYGHLYSPFYVFNYATGISAANALAKRIREGAPGAAEKYLEALRLGGSKYPIEALQHAGIDMTRPDPVNEAFEVLAGFVDRLEALAAGRG